MNNRGYPKTVLLFASFCAGDDDYDRSVAVCCVWGDESGTNARCVGALDAGERAGRVRALAQHTRETEQKCSQSFCFRKLMVPLINTWACLGRAIITSGVAITMNDEMRRLRLAIGWLPSMLLLIRWPPLRPTLAREDRPRSGRNYTSLLALLLPRTPFCRCTLSLTT
jgi:hypothetical protein